MRLSHRFVGAIIGGLALLPFAASATMASSRSASPVIVQQDKQFGHVLFTPQHKALYYWTTEKKAGGKIRCTGACAKRWPPLYAASAAVPRHVAGISGTFGTIKRPDGRLQVTYNGLAIYSYADDPVNKIFCNNFDGWFVVRA